MTRAPTWVYEQALLVALLAPGVVLAVQGDASPRGIARVVLGAAGAIVGQKLRSGADRQREQDVLAGYTPARLACAARIARWAAVAQVLAILSLIVGTRDLAGLLAAMGASDHGELEAPPRRARGRRADRARDAASAAGGRVMTGILAGVPVCALCGVQHLEPCAAAWATTVDLRRAQEARRDAVMAAPWWSAARSGGWNFDGTTLFFHALNVRDGVERTPVNTMIERLLLKGITPVPTQVSIRLDAGTDLRPRPRRAIVWDLLQQAREIGTQEDADFWFEILVQDIRGVMPEGAPDVVCGPIDGGLEAALFVDGLRVGRLVVDAAGRDSWEATYR